MDRNPKPTFAALFVAALLAWPCAISAQQDVPAPVTAVVLDPTGVLRVGDDFEVRFPLLQWPAAGAWQTGAEGAPQFGLVRDGELTAPAGATLELRSLTPERVALRAVLGDRTVAVDAAPELRRIEPPRVIGAPPDRPRPPAGLPATEPENLLFVALGSGGTGLPGQRRVADGLRRFAARHPVDFVLLLGDELGPQGVASRGDPAWLRCFESVYDPQALALPFYAAVGDLEHRGDLPALVEYGVLNLRWTMPDLSYSFEAEAHGVRFAFIAMDTPACAGNTRDAYTRRAQTLVAHALETCHADWRIVFGHDPLLSHDLEGPVDRRDVLRLRMAPWLERYHVDLYIAGGDRSLQLIDSAGDVPLQVVSGGAGGPEVASPVAWGEDTLFAATGGGFTSFRFDGETLFVVFHDADGAPLFVHELRK
ncbi:MAG: metallophosphoesterase [Planctomycetes bacterium]|nr:metallophosphoesterase [Planctomycetota bacterium]